MCWEGILNTSQVLKWLTDFSRKLNSRIDAFELWCWRRLLRVPWTARRSNQSILKEISPGCSLEGLMLKLKLQYFDHRIQRTETHWKRPWCWERLKAGGEGDDGGWDGWVASPTQRTWVLVNSGSWWWTGRPGVLQSLGSQRVGQDWATELSWDFSQKEWSSESLTVTFQTQWLYPLPFKASLVFRRKAFVWWLFTLSPCYFEEVFEHSLLVFRCRWLRTVSCTHT